MAPGPSHESLARAGWIITPSAVDILSGRQGRDLHRFSSADFVAEYTSIPPIWSGSQARVLFTHEAPHEMVIVAHS
jgi:hypothetical protein